MVTCPHCGEKAITRFKKIFWFNWGGRTCPRCGQKFKLPGYLGISSFVFGIITARLTVYLHFPVNWIFFVLMGILAGVIVGFVIPLVPAVKPGASQR